MSISQTLVRRVNRARFCGSTHCGNPAVNPKQEGVMTIRFMTLYKPGKEATAPPSNELFCRDGEVNRGNGEGWRASRYRRAPTEFAGCARSDLWRKVHRHRWALHRSEGADCRPRDCPGEVEGRGDRMGQALPQSNCRR